MRVLITNTRLDYRGGEEPAVQALARELQQRGHAVIAWSSDTRQRPRLLENDVVPVVTDLARLPHKPDILHAQHHLDAMAALATLPDVPAVFQVSATDPGAQAPLHRRIYRVLEADATMPDAIDTLVETYHAVIAEHRTVPHDSAADLRATFRYLAGLTSVIKMTDAEQRGHWAAAWRANTFQDLRAQLMRLEASLETLEIARTPRRESS